VHIDSNDVFWMVQVEHDALEVDFNEGFARLRVKHLDVYDDHDLANSLTQGLGLPAGAAGPAAIPGVPPVRATVSFDVEWKGIVTMADINNSAQKFKGSFLSTGATIKWSADEPGFHFESETPPDPKANLVSVLGREKNGVFFT
jgi:hypothetical protein